MRAALVGSVAVSTVIVSLAGCGSGGYGGGTPPPPGPTTIGVTFTGATPQAAAVQMGSGAFTTASIQGGQLSFTLPAGTTTYTLAYVCPPFPNVVSTENDEFLIQATVQDPLTYTLSCRVTPTVGSVTASVDATVIPGAASVAISGKQGFGASIASNHGSFNTNMPAGTNDIAVLALDSSNNVLAVRILRSQTVPGAVNGGSTIFLGPSDETSLQTVTVNNTPSGFIPAEQFVLYSTANGTELGLGLSSATQYRVVPAATAQAGDTYFIDSSTDDTATGNLVVGENLTMTSANPVVINLPPVWSYSGPTPAARPTFAFNYSGFSASSSLGYNAILQWQPNNSTLTSISITATSSFQKGVTTISIPDLTSLPGSFGSFAPAPSGTRMNWVGVIFNGDQTVSFVGKVPNGPFVETRGVFTEP